MFKMTTLMIVGFSVQAWAQLAMPSCPQWQKEHLLSEACSCNGEVRRGDERGQKCTEKRQSAETAPNSFFFKTTEMDAAKKTSEGIAVGTENADRALKNINSAFPSGEAANGTLASSPASIPAPAPASPSSSVSKGPRRFGFHSVSVTGGRIEQLKKDGAGRGFGGQASVEIFRSKNRHWSGGVGFGTLTMKRGAIYDTDDLGPVDPNDPTAGELIAQNFTHSPAVKHIPMGEFTFNQDLFHKRVTLSVGGEVGVARLSNHANAIVNTTIGILDPNGGFTPTQTLPPQFFPTGEKVTHVTGGPLFKLDIDLNKRGWLRWENRFFFTPSLQGYGSLSTGLKIDIDRLRHK